MNRHPLDYSAAVSYIAGGGLAGVAVLLAVLDPGHSAIYTACGVMLVAIAGLVRTILNPTPPVGTVAVVQDKPTTPVS